MVSEGKTTKALLGLSEARKREIGEEIERLLKTDLRYITNSYVNSYQAATFNTFGWTREDLMQLIRIVLWKGLATYNPDRKVSKNTYLSAILGTCFCSLSRKCKRKKHSEAKLFCIGEDPLPPSSDPDVLSFALEVEGEEWVYKMLDLLTPTEQKIFELHFLDRMTIRKVIKKTRRSKKFVLESIEAIRQKAKDFIRESEDEEDFDDKF